MTCARGDHRAPRTGGSCECGVVSFHPAPAKPACPTCAQAVEVVDRLDNATGDQFFTVAAELADLIDGSTR